jgi:cystathionine beta-lyase family protein involved in aluminum resistance
VLTPVGEKKLPEAARQLREIEATILEACPDAPVTLKRLASLSGYGYNPNFRDACDRLVTLGLLIRSKAGVRKR